MACRGGRRRRFGDDGAGGKRVVSRVVVWRGGRRFGDVCRLGFGRGWRFGDVCCFSFGRGFFVFFGVNGSLDAVGIKARYGLGVGAGGREEGEEKERFVHGGFRWGKWVALVIREAERRAHFKAVYVVLDVATTRIVCCPTSSRSHFTRAVPVLHRGGSRPAYAHIMALVAGAIV